jgi:N-acetylmuramoyl-L-alanine amidase
MRRRLIIWMTLFATVLAVAAPSYLVTAAPGSIQQENEPIIYRGSTACGVERWSVKTGMDGDAGKVNAKSVTQTTIFNLRSLHPPGALPLKSRVRPVETTVFSVSAKLLRVKQEADSDFHLVLSDSGGRTMIAEIPSPSCISSSPFLPSIRYVRSKFTAAFHPTDVWSRPNVTVQVTGVGFFDLVHGKNGVAPNGIQLHPVLALRFGGSSGQMHQQGLSHRIVVVLDPGHGGPDTGAVHYLPDGRIDLMEKTTTLEIALRVATVLRSHGYLVSLTRTSDRAVNIPPRDYNHDGTIDDVDELEARVVFANRHHATLFVSIHSNASSDPGIHGLTVYYCPAHPFAAGNLRLAQVLDRAMDQHLQHVGYAPLDWGVHSDVSLQVPQHYADYPWFLTLGPAAPQHGLVAQNAVAALGESLYVTNDREAALLHQPRILAALAAGYAEGIERYVETTPRP